jgi:gliding motility-associated-like protein
MRFYTRFLLFTFLLSAIVFSAKAAPVAHFTASPDSGCVPLVVYFTNTSTGATHYKWDFGDLSVSYLTSPSTSYIKAGTYTVTLTAYGPGGDSSVTTATIIVYPLPTVSFTATPSSACPGTPIVFTSTSTGGVPGPLTYVWAFGDGDTSSAISPTHVYTASGYYNITLTATNSKGCQSSLTKTAYVHIYDLPLPAFKADVTTFCKVPAHAVFHDLTTGAGPYTYSWDFGDGGSSALASPTHDYLATGTYTVKLTVTDAHGCTNTITMYNYITVGTIKAGFIQVDTACVNSPVTFTDTSSTHTSATWLYGDGASDGSGTHTYTSTGLFTVTLIIFNGPCSDTVKHNIYIRPGPVVSFTQNPLHPCPPPTTITFTGTVPTGATVTWDFGDGRTGTGATTSHLYSTKGIYKIIMTVTDPVTGCKSSVSRIDTLYDMIFKVYAKPTQGCVPLTVNFWDSTWTSVPGPGLTPYPYPTVSWAWTFGDGGSSTLATPSHTYTAVGIYWAHLTITTANGCTFTDSIEIKVGKPPQITVKAIPTHMCYGQTDTFVVTVVVGPVDSFVYIFGDGSGEEVDSVFTITHKFVLPGIFTVTVTPYYHGCKGVPYVIPTPITVDSPMAIISDIVYCSPANTVAFGDSSLGDNSRLWMFGDGTTDTSKNPLHHYATSGIYTIKLATYNKASGCRDTATVTVDLLSITPDFTVPKRNICKGDALLFTSVITGSGSVKTYRWSSYGVAPDSSSSTYDPTFSTGGVFDIRLIVTDQNGCADTVLKKAYITVGAPVVSFTAAPASGCAPLTVTFTDHSTDVAGLTISSYKWAFGDGATTTVTVPTVVHTFTTAGSFSTTETITDNIGCKASVTLNLVTVYKPTASFSASNVYPCAGDSIQFLNSSTGITASYWNFGDGTTSTLTSPWHTYSATGTYTVTLAVTDSHGCTDTAVFPSYILVTQPIAAFTMSDSFAICPPLTVNFINTSTGATSYGWTLGDGSSSVLVNPSDLYIAVGTYAVTLTAVNKYGCTSSVVHYVDIIGSSATFSYTPLQGCVPLTVYFTAPTKAVPNVIWDFSDGTTVLSSYSDTISHTYTLAGAYVPRLILSDLTGCQASILGPDTIKVDEVFPGFTTNPNPVCVHELVKFMDTSTSYFSTINSWLWTFTYGDTSMIKAPVKEYDTIGTYPVNLVVTDGWGCTANISNDVIVYPPAPISVSPDTTICLTDYATLTGYGGVSYTWAPPASVSCTSCNPTHASPNTITTYTVTGTDAHGCINTDTTSVFLKYKTVSVGKGDTQACQGAPVPLYDSGATKWTWIPASGLSNPFIQDPWASPDVTTVYAVIAQLAGCIADTNYVTVIIHPLPTVNAGPDQTLVEGSTAQLNATGTLINKLWWADPETLSCDSCASPVASMLVTTTYVVAVSTNFGCLASDSVTIHLFCDKSQIFVPNVFTPNGDGQNDVFYPRGKGISDIKSFRIYNRWGQLLFERSNIKINDASNAWDGTYLGSMPRPDVYVYVIDAICETGAPINIKGDVTIIK